METKARERKSIWRIFTIAKWLPEYSRNDFRGDFVAGLTVGVMLIPQSMAYALLAGVPPIYGLYASLVPLLVYPIFGTSRQLAGGVIAIDMLIVAAGLVGFAELASERYIELAILLALMAGAIQIGMGIARLGFVVSLLSRPIVAGFASAAALLIAASQLDSLMGVELPASKYILVLLTEIGRNIGSAHLASLGLGLGTVVLLVGFRRWLPRAPAALVIVVIATLGVWWFRLDTQGIAVVGGVRSGLPPFRVPDISILDVRELVPTAVTLALVQFMSVITLGKVFAARHKYTIRPNRELVAMGAANVLGSFFRSIPVSGSFSRTAVNDAAGARTPLANVFAALLIVLTLLFLTPFIWYLPITVLAAIIIVAAVGLFDVKEMQALWRIKRVDGAVALLTFLITLFVGIQEGILTGMAVSVVAIMYRISRPHIAELGHLPGTRSFRDVQRNEEARAFDGLLIIRVDASFSFANADFLRDSLLRRTAKDSSIRAVLIDAHSVNDLDTTAAASLRFIADFLKERDIEMYFGGVKGPVRDVIRDCGLNDDLGDDHFFLSPHRAVKHILAKWGADDPYLQSIPGQSLAEAEEVVADDETDETQDHATD